MYDRRSRGLLRSAGGGVRTGLEGWGTLLSNWFAFGVGRGVCLELRCRLEGRVCVGLCILKQRLRVGITLLDFAFSRDLRCSISR